MRAWIGGGLALGALVLAGQAWAQGTTTPGVPSDFGWKDGITLAIAVLGAVLGILNYWNTISARRVRVLVHPAHSIPVGGAADVAPGFQIEVVNLSSFAVTVAEVGFIIPEGRLIIPQPMVIDGGKWPRRLEARESVTLFFYPHRWVKLGTRIRRAYARLSSGEIPTGTSPALRQVRDEILTGKPYDG